MNSSGKKRGLAIAAVSALAVVGLPMAASAQTVEEGQGAFQLYSQYSGGASVRNDGENTTVTLMAAVPDTLPAVQVKFSYTRAVGAPVEIGNVVPIDGVATLQWTPPTDATERANITGVTAEAFDNATASIASDNNPIVGASLATAQAANLDGALRSDVGIGPDDEIVVTGKTTDTAANTDVQVLGPVAAGAVGTTTTGNPDANNVSAFEAIVPVGAGNDTADAEDELVVGVAVTGSDDVNVYTGYTQQVASATVAPSSATVQAGAPVEDSKYTITVKDQKGAPIQGLDIYESNSAGTPTDGNGRAADGSASAGGETNTKGEFTAVLRESDIDNGTDQNSDPNVQATHYVVDVNQNGTYESGTDYRFQITQNRYAATPTTIEISSAKGNALDDDETSVITILVKDQNGNPMQGVTPIVSVKKTNTDLDEAAGTNPVTTNPGVGATDAEGKTTFTLDPDDAFTQEHVINAFVNNNGTPQPDTGDAIASPLTVVSDTSSIVWEQGANHQAGSGTTTTLTGMLVQDESGTPLGNRAVEIDYAADDNSELAAQASQPAGTTRLDEDEATAITNAEGKFSVAVTDPATPAGQELDNTLTAQAAAPLNNGNRFTDADEDGVVDGGELAADSTAADIDIDFLRSLTPDRVVIFNDLTGNQNDGLDNWFFGGSDLQPGEGAVGYVQAFNADGIELTDVDVELTIDEGHFVDQDNVFDGTPTPGDAVDLSDAGKTVTVSTGDSSFGYFLANIERHEGFDDDGRVRDAIRATVAGATDQHDLEWNTIGTPLNPAAENPLVVELSEDQESSILPKARAGDAFNGSGQFVNYDVMSFDQFGNVTEQNLDTTDNTPVADFEGGDSTTFALGQPAIMAHAETDVDQVLDIELEDAETWTYSDNPYDSSFDPNDPGIFVQGTPDIRETTDAINWYSIDFDASTFTLGQQGAQNVPVGATVTEVLRAVDQEGQPVEGLTVDFFRGGPGDEDSDGNNWDETDNQGRAFYDFVGGSAGTATITGVIYDDNGNRVRTVGPDTVRFGTAGIVAKLTGKNNGGKADRLKVNAPDRAAGAKVVLWKFTKNGMVRVAQGSLNDNGNKSFKVKDRNGNKFTKYVAKVKKTSASSADTTNAKRVR